MKLGDVNHDTDLVRLRWEDPAIAVIELADTAGRNALSPELTGALLAALEETAQARECTCVILTSEPGDWFCSGATRALLEDLKTKRVAPSELGLTGALLRHPSVIVVAANGHAVGGGFALAVAGDFVFAAEDARYGFNFMAHGLTPGMGATRLAEDFLGRPLAHRLLYTGDILRGRDIYGHGIEICESDQVLDRATVLAYGIAAHPRQNVAMLKQSLVKPRLAAFDRAVQLEADMHKTSIETLQFESWSSND